MVIFRAGVAELADARDSKSRSPCESVGSTPSSGTNSVQRRHAPAAQSLTVVVSAAIVPTRAHSTQPDPCRTRVSFGRVIEVFPKARWKSPLFPHGIRVKQTFVTQTDSAGRYAFASFAELRDLVMC